MVSRTGACETGGRRLGVAGKPGSLALAYLAAAKGSGAPDLILASDSAFLNSRGWRRYGSWWWKGGKARRRLVALAEEGVARFARREGVLIVTRKGARRS